MRFSNKVVAITGAAQGIGRQTAEQAAREGARLLLFDRSRYVHELAAALNVPADTVPDTPTEPTARRVLRSIDTLSVTMLYPSAARKLTGPDTATCSLS